MKNYFASRGTVSTWWRSENWSAVRRLYLEEQLGYVCSALEWRGKSVLDAGTGFGRFARALALQGANVTGIDLNPDMIEMACRENSDLSESIMWQNGDVESLPFRDESFDAVVCLEVLMHCPDPSKAVSELARVARPGGTVFLGVNNRYSLPFFVNALHLHKALYRWLKSKPVNHRTCTIGQLRSWIRKANLKLEDEIGIGLLQPEVYLDLVPGVSVQLVHDGVSERVLSFEKSHKLGRTC